ncbi:MAG: ester cyclase [Chloroflexi bacterium]|nr:ester cyclase [Chloroflexota bacterium]
MAGGRWRSWPRFSRPPSGWSCLTLRRTSHRVNRQRTPYQRFSVKATGKRVTFSETHIVWIVNGKAIEHWGNQDDMAMMQQLGVIPEG